jgi:hypothetical protein
MIFGMELGSTDELYTTMAPGVSEFLLIDAGVFIIVSSSWKLWELGATKPILYIDFVEASPALHAHSTAI